MLDPLVLETTQGPITLRDQQAQDADFLYQLFRSHTLPNFAPLPVDDAMKESLVRMQFTSRTATYHAQYPTARFAVLQHEGTDIGHVVIDETPETACIVDIELIPAARGRGIGSALMISLVQWFGSRCAAIRCMVLASNEPSLRMFHRAGFTHVTETPPYVELEWRRAE